LYSLSIHGSTWKDMEVCASTQSDTTPNADLLHMRLFHGCLMDYMGSRFSPNQITPTIALEAKPGPHMKENSLPLIRRPVNMLIANSNFPFYVVT
ncbi:hypothetical protein AVEN_52798-1, partial [Araneus ventricosus]